MTREADPRQVRVPCPYANQSPMPAATCAEFQNAHAEDRRIPNGRCMGAKCRKYRKALALRSPWELAKVLAAAEMEARAKGADTGFLYPMCSVANRRYSVPDEVLRDMRREGLLERMKPVRRVVAAEEAR